MRNKIFILCALSFVLILFAFGLFKSNNERESKETIIQSATSIITEYWSGLPISSSNPLYHDPSKDLSFHSNVKNMIEELSSFSSDDLENDDIFLPLLSKYKPLVGWNGVFDAINISRGQYDNIGMNRLHSLGKLVSEDATEPKHAVEITSRDILHKAPLHEAIWTYIVDFGTSDLDNLYSFINEELCYFRDTPGFGVVWISCAHGVGHGLGNIYGLARIREAVDVCVNFGDDEQFHYACASGVYMSLGPEFTKESFAPCDTLPIPSTCYRFRNKLFEHHRQKGIEVNCLDESLDLYHQVGCMFGEGYSYANDVKGGQLKCDSYLKVNSRNEPYLTLHAACIDGLLSVFKGQSAEEAKSTCRPWKQIPKSYDVCKKRMTTKDQFSLDEEFYYNTELLESFNPEK